MLLNRVVILNLKFLASGNTNYAVAPSGHIEFKIAGQGVIPIMLLHQVVILNFGLLAKW